MPSVAQFVVKEAQCFGETIRVIFDITNQFWWNLASLFPSQKIATVLSGKKVAEDSPRGYLEGNSYHFLWLSEERDKLDHLYVSHFLFLSFFLNKLSKKFRFEFASFSILALKEKVLQCSKPISPVLFEKSPKRRKIIPIRQV